MRQWIIPEQTHSPHKHRIHSPDSHWWLAKIKHDENIYARISIGWGRDVSDTYCHWFHKFAFLLFSFSSCVCVFFDVNFILRHVLPVTIWTFIYSQLNICTADLISLKHLHLLRKIFAKWLSIGATKTTESLSQSSRAKNSIYKIVSYLKIR